MSNTDMPAKRQTRNKSSNNVPQDLNNTNNLIKNKSNKQQELRQIGSTTNNAISINNNKKIGKNLKKSISFNNYSASTLSYASTNNANNNNKLDNSAINGGDGLTEKQIRVTYLGTLTKEQLKFECKKRGQKTNGNRTELLQRLGVKMSQLKHSQEELQNRTKQKQNHNNNNININNNNTNNNNNNNSNNNNHCLENNSVGGKKINNLNKIANGSASNGTMFSVKKHSSNKSIKEREREEREKIVLWRRPIETIKYSTLESITLIHTYGKQLLQHRVILFGLVLLVGLIGVSLNIPGKHQIVIEVIRSNTWFVIYWVGLGVLSSVGLGTGLHTFLLYLGPHIASVTLAAYECNALNFPKPPYPDEIICPEIADTRIIPNLWNIMAKVRLEAFLWGAGTALGELPPYFMAKAARLSGYDPDDAEDLKEFEELKKKQNSDNLSRMDRAKLFMERVVEKVGFFGILACASIPNPLFDLAGITCGHFLVPFWTFFGATLLGKAVIKMHIQKIFVIIAFNESLIERAVDLLVLIPIFGKRLQEPFKSFLFNQKQRLHRNKLKTTSQAESSGNLLSKIFEYFVVGMICYFIISIINSLAQNYYKRINKKGNSKTNLKKIAKE